MGLCLVLAGIFRAIIWLLLWLFVGWPVAFFISWFYVLLLPFGACVDVIRRINEQLLRLVQLPLTFAVNMMEMKPIC